MRRTTARSVGFGVAFGFLPGVVPAVILVAALLMAPPALAVPSGCGSPACINIAGLTGDTFDLGTWNGTANTVTSATLRHCVFSNRPNSGTKTYDVTPTGNGTTGGAFLLSGPGGDLPYEIEIRDGSGGSIPFTVVAAGTTASFTSLSEANFDLCSDSATSNRGQRLRVRVYETDMVNFVAGTYSGSLRLDVATPVGSASDFEISGTISIEIPELVRLLRLQNNFNFGTWDPDSAAGQTVSDSSVCVWSNHVSSAYTVTATASAGAFEMTQGGDSVPFRVWWSDSAGISTTAASDQELGYSVPATFFGDGSGIDCGGGSNASIVIETDEDGLAAAVAGAYATDLTITIGVAP